MQYDTYDPWLQKNDKSPEKSLWVAVLLQQVLDFKTRSQDNDSLYNKRVANLWLDSANADFRDVCVMAGFNPKYVIKSLAKSRESGFQWRAAPGMGLRYLERRQYRLNQKGFISMTASFRHVLIAERERIMRELALVDRMIKAVDEKESTPESPVENTEHPVDDAPIAFVNEFPDDPYHKVRKKRRVWTAGERQEVHDGLLYKKASVHELAAKFDTTPGNIYQVYRLEKMKAGNEKVELCDMPTTVSYS